MIVPFNQPPTGDVSDGGEAARVFAGAVFLDTVGLLAVWDARDQWHVAATRELARLTATRVKLVTTTFVLLECGNAASRRPYRMAVDIIRGQLDRVGRLLTPTEVDWQFAWEGYRRGVVGDAGLVDHVSFAVMRRLGLSQVFGNDRHFRAAGFEPLF